MLIVLEGCDGAGKTTLAGQLVKEAELRGWEAEVWHRGVPVRHPLEEYELDLEQDYPSSAENRARRLIIADRWHLGQLVYGPLYRKDLKDFDMGCAWHVDALLQSVGALQLILSPPLEVIRDRLAIRGEDYLQEGHVQYVHEAYESMVNVTNSEAISNVGNGIFNRSFTILREPLDDDDVRVLVDTVECRSRRADGLIPFKTYVGPRYPGILLFGDRHNGSDIRPPSPFDHRAAFVPYGGTSGRWLSSAIAESPLNQFGIGIANANQENVEPLVSMLNSPRVVALGQEAHKTLEKYDIEHGTVPHPQYARRFKHSHGPAYTDAIFNAAILKTEVLPRW